jgi:hypothetical protein
MPIKFRCSYCRQFLGISRSRAGEVFDCPTCGRTIRVPSLDGSVAPLPEPEMNAGDAHLARALDELASLANGNPIPQPAVAVADAEAEAEAQIPQPLPEPEPVELPLPAVVTPIAPPMLASAANSEPAPVVSLADLLPLAASMPAPSAMPSQPSGLPISRGIAMAALLSPVVTLLIGLQVGRWLGRTDRGPATSPKLDVAINAPAAAVTEPQLTGRVSWRTDAGETKPDIGAIVIVWPESWDGATRFSPFGLRPADSDADQAAAAGMARGMGGGLAHTSADGTYQLSVSQPGRYRRLMISRLKSRPAATPIPPVVLRELQQYLADPAASLGERAYEWDTVVIEAGRNPPADQVF